MTAHQHDHDHHHGHGHAGHSHAGHSHAPSSFGPAFAVGVVLNTALVAAQIVYGFAAHSMALLADAVHNLGDVLGLLMAWGAIGLGRRLPSARWTYGWGRSTILAALANAMILLVSVGGIAVEAIQRLRDPVAVDGATVMWVAGAGILINGVSALLFSRGQADLNIRAAFLHLAGDAAVSAGVVVAALLIGLTGWLWLDAATSLAIAVVILLGSWGVLLGALNLAMDGVPGGIARDEVEDCLRHLPGVAEVHDLHIWGLSTSETALTAHLVCPVPASGEELILHATHELAERFGIGHATLQVETPETAAACRLRPAEVV